ncbi:MAG: hypothetical protein R3A44_13780 [Caldilineaceae bacterium]
MHASSFFQLRHKFLILVAAFMFATVVTWLPAVSDQLAGTDWVTPAYADDDEHGGG